MLRSPAVRRLSVVLAIVSSAVLGGCGDSPTGLPRTFRGCGEVRSYAIGTAVAGTFAEGDCRVPADLIESRPFLDLHRFTLDAPRTVTIVQRSDEVDSFLFLFDAEETLIAWNDDGDPETELGSRITITLDPGTYVLGATPGHLGGPGAYALLSL